MSLLNDGGRIPTGGTVWAIHANLGRVQLASNIGGWTNGTTLIVNSDGVTVEATTAYLTLDERSDRPDTGT